jgi:hypothetical protein
VLSGAAVDEGVVCADATVDDYWREWIDADQMLSYFDVECNDGSGTITIAELMDFTEIDPWEVTERTWTLEGSGDYESLTGSGEWSIDDEVMWHDVDAVET